MPNTRSTPRPLRRCAAGLLTAALTGLLAGLAHADAESPAPRIDGDIGLGLYAKRSVVNGASEDPSVLPYLSFDAGRLFARVDTFGLKTLPLGWGHVELVGRFSQDGFRTDTPALSGLSQREDSVPLGLGTLQITPYGGVWLNAFHDVRASGGKLFELIYAGQFKLSRVTITPLVGAEYQSRDYVRYFYGVSAQEAASSAAPAYEPGGAFNPQAGLLFDLPLAGPYHLKGHIRRKWLDDSIRRSPLVDQRHQDSAYLALSYRFR